MVFRSPNGRTFRMVCADAGTAVTASAAATITPRYLFIVVSPPYTVLFSLIGWCGCGSLDMVAGHPMTTGFLFERRRPLGTDRGRHRTPRSKPAAGRQRAGARNLALQQCPPSAPARMGDRNGVQQGPCIGMPRIFEERIAGGDFDDGAEIHDRNRRADEFHDAQV